MSPTPPNRADIIFGEALDLPLKERETHLMDACGDDADLLAEVRDLLAAHDAAPTAFLDSPVLDEITGDLDATVAADGSGKTSGKPSGSRNAGDDDVDPLSLLRAFKESDPDGSPPETLTEKAGDVIGSYKLLQQIGEGGFGTVWMAEQSEPIIRKVALKVIKAGMDTREVLARFDAERQAVALMDNPNIAKVLDAGATKAGRPWFAMELVKGLPITQFCDEQKLSTRQRLELFGDVCSAINHAHQKGVIHRDIKPNNVMVTLHGDKPVVKVIDFGIAKATQSKLTDKTLFTAFEQMLGTPIYMSPEQASLSGLDIDTRSDIYSLGVLLYELLTGKPPFDGKTLISAGYEEMRRIIREEEPPRPSLRLSTASEKDETTRITTTHGVEPQKLSRLVRGELDWIVMKAIEKDRSRRYETANAFAADIGRYLSDEAVEAAAPSAVYKFRKFARRNKVAIGTAALITFVLIVATGVSTWQAIEAHQARVQSDKDKEDAEAIASYLVEVFQSPDPARDGRTITVAETLDTAAAKLETDLPDQPERRAQLQKALGSTYGALGLFREAIPLQKKRLEYHLQASGPGHPDTLSAMNNLAASYSDAGRLDEALELQEEVLVLRRKVFGPEHPQTLASMSNLAASYRDAGRGEEAIELQEEVLELFRMALGPEHVDTFKAIHNLALSYSDASQLDEAIELQKEVLELFRKVLGPKHVDTFKAMNNLAVSYRDAGRLDEALDLREKVMEHSRKILGEEHPDTLRVMGNLAVSYRDAGRLDEALALREKVMEHSRKVLGDEHPHTLASMHNLANSYSAAGRQEKALTMEAKVLELSIKVLGEEHPKTLNAMGNLALSYHYVGRRDEALELQEEVLELSRKVLGPEHPDTLGAMSNLALSYHDAGRREEALDLQEGVMEQFRKVLGEEHPDTLRAMNNLAVSYHKAGRLDEALDLREKVLELSRKVLGSEHPDTFRAMGDLALSYRDAGRWEEALALREKVMEHSHKVLGEEHPDTLSAMGDLANSYHEAGRRDEALEVQEKVLELSRKVLSPEHPQMLRVMANLALFYSEAGRLDEALKLGEEVLDLSRMVLGEEHPDTLRAMANLASSYHEAGRRDEALALREKVLDVRIKVLGEEHPDTLIAMNNLVVSYRDLGRIDEAGKMIAQFLLINGDQFGVKNEGEIGPNIVQVFKASNIVIKPEEPSEKAISDYYETHADTFSDTAVHLRMISAPKPAKTRESIEKLRKKLIEGGDFATAAKAHSDDSFASKGGDRGWIKRGDLRQDLTDVAFAVKPGQVSEVIEDDTHLRLLKVEERKEGEVLPLSEVSDQVIAKLTKEAQKARVDGWIEEAKRQLAADRKVREEYKNKDKGDE